MLIVAGTLTVLAGLLYWIDRLTNNAAVDLAGLIRVLILIAAGLIGLNFIFHPA